MPVLYFKIKWTPDTERILKDAHMNIEVDITDSSNKRIERINLRDVFGKPDSIYTEEESKYLMKR